jgi:hypothetical protein
MVVYLPTLYWKSWQAYAHYTWAINLRGKQYTNLAGQYKKNSSSLWREKIVPLSQVMMTRNLQQTRGGILSYLALLDENNAILLQSGMNMTGG